MKRNEKYSLLRALNFLPLFFVIFIPVECFADIIVKKNSDAELVCSVWLNEVKTEVKKAIRMGKGEERIFLNIGEGTEDISMVGCPALPFVEYRILLPKGLTVKNIDSALQNTERKIIPLKITFIPAPINNDDYNDPQKRKQWENSLQENAEIYNADNFYPRQNISYEQKIYRGYRVMHLKINPFKYNPAKNELFFSRHVVCNVLLEKETDSARIPDIYLRNKESDMEFIKNMVVNKEEINSYKKGIEEKR